MLCMQGGDVTGAVVSKSFSTFLRNLRIDNIDVRHSGDVTPGQLLTGRRR